MVDKSTQARVCAYAAQRPVIAASFRFHIFYVIICSSISLEYTTIADTATVGRSI